VVARLGRSGVGQAVAGVALAVLAPLMVFIAIAVKLSSPGPVLVRRTRRGGDGRVVTVRWFRTTVARPGGEPHLTAVGRCLRCWALDQLPQLWNVVRGDLTLRS
jgi:putative colanic acid biosynthesis UDP-glucose lipid carrier transferase